MRYEMLMLLPQSRIFLLPAFIRTTMQSCTSNSTVAALLQMTWVDGAVQCYAVQRRAGRL